MENKYRLEKYNGSKSRFSCPKCQKTEKTFTRYIDVHTNQYISDIVGRCSREIKCGYHFTPAQYFSQHGIANVGKINRKPWIGDNRSSDSSFSCITTKIFTDSLCKGKTNHFLDFLAERFGKEKVKEATEKYRIGTSKKWFGATVFWQIDFEGRVRTGKIMLYDANTGKRVKNNGAKVSWVHSELRFKDFELKQCFFGEHLLNEESKIVAIVESEKTAIIASIFWPEYIWIATGGIQNFKLDNCKYLSGRNVIVFPDLGGYENWVKKVESFSMIANFKVNNFLELHATAEEKLQGLDLADYLLKFDLNKFRSGISKTDKTPTVGSDEIQPIKIPEREEALIESVDAVKSESWDGSYDELELYLSKYKFEIETYQLDNCTRINDVPKFVKSHLSVLKEHWSNKIYISFLHRLRTFIVKSNL